MHPKNKTCFLSPPTHTAETAALSATENNDGDSRDNDDDEINVNEAVLDELDDLFAMLAAQRRGEMLFAEVGTHIHWFVLPP